MRTPTAGAVLVLCGALGSAAVPALAAPPGDGKAEAPKETPYKEQFKDEILLKGARAPMTGVEVVTDAYDKVEWKTKSGPLQHRDRSEVASLKLGDEPATFSKGMESYRTGRLDEADANFRGTKSAIETGRARRLWEARAQAYIGSCRLRAAATASSDAKFKEAASVFEDARKLDPKSPLIDMVLLGLADAQAGAKDWDSALKTLDELKKIGSEAARPLWEGHARLARGRLLEHKGEVGGASSEYSDLAKFAESAATKLPPDSPERREMDGLKVNGLVSQGWALYGRAEKTKSPVDLDLARKHFEGLPSATGDSAAGRAASANGLGGILLLEGKFQKAVEKFIEVEVTMFQVPDEVARALWYKSMAYDRLGNGGGREQALKDLAEFYPWSEWSVRAH